jgi:hypothetical protein
MKICLSTSLATSLALSTSLAVIGSGGCHSFEDIQPLPFMEQSTDGGSCPKLPDLGVPPAQTCKAAQGLAGDSLLCVDFSQISMVPDTQKLPGWDFSCAGGASWTTTGGALQVSNFSTFKDECTARLPALNLNDADKQKYKTLTLALVHRIDLNDPEQQAEIFLNTSMVTRRMYQTAGKKDVPRQRTILEINKADLPAALNNTPQWLLKVSSSLQVGRAGWQIESLAVLGNTQ